MASTLRKWARWLAILKVLGMVAAGAAVAGFLVDLVWRGKSDAAVASAVAAAVAEHGGVRASPVAGFRRLVQTVTSSAVEGFLAGVNEAGGSGLFAFEARAVVSSESGRGAGQVVGPPAVAGEDPAPASGPPEPVVLQANEPCPAPLRYLYQDPAGVGLEAARAVLMDPDIWSAGGETLRLRQSFRVSGGLVGDRSGQFAGKLDLEEVDPFTGAPLEGSEAAVWGEAELTVDVGALRDEVRPRLDLAFGLAARSVDLCSVAESSVFVPEIEGSVPTDVASCQSEVQLGFAAEGTWWRGRSWWILPEPGLRFGGSYFPDSGGWEVRALLALRR